MGLRLELVVELLGEALADLLRHRLRVHARGHHLRDTQDQAQVLKVGAHGARDARVLDLDRHAPAVVQPRPVHLADRGGRERLRLELGEHVLERLAQVGLEHLAHLLERHARRGVAQLGELLLQAPVDLGRQRARVDERRHLADLHRGALHLPEHVEDALGHLDLTPLGGLAAPLLRARQVGGASRVGARRLAAGEAADAGGAAQPPGGDRVLGHAMTVAGGLCDLGHIYPLGVADRLRRDGRGQPLPARAALEGADPRLRHRGARHGARARDEGAPARPGRRGAG